MDEVAVHLARTLGRVGLPLVESAGDVCVPVFQSSETTRQLSFVVQNALHLGLQLPDAEHRQGHELVGGHGGRFGREVGHGGVPGYERVVELARKWHGAALFGNAERPPEIKTHLSVERVAAPEESATQIERECVELVVTLEMETKVDTDTQRRSQDIPDTGDGRPHQGVERKTQNALERLEPVVGAVDGVDVQHGCVLEVLRNMVRILEERDRRRDGKYHVHEKQRDVKLRRHVDGVGDLDEVGIFVFFHLLVEDPRVLVVPGVFLSVRRKELRIDGGVGRGERHVERDVATDSRLRACCFGGKSAIFDPATVFFSTEGSMMDWLEVCTLWLELSGPRRLTAVTMSLENEMPEEAPMNEGGAFEPEAAVEFWTLSM
ncbi:hypothetical protein OGATHE_004095 [Ogataea polymorpha]|uniref:Uncharacterized protein n=1 Tax=Ogataea polymorpha TaxID=460523 RepID=A0A9P8P4U4_9ASCO|nr:hypothetical protein OGATHE_004095 [Ogataea polymorpha]